MTPTPEPTAAALGVSLTLGSALLAVEGFASPEVERAYRRAQVLAQALHDTRQSFPALNGLSDYHRVRAEFATSDELGRQLMDIPRESGIRRCS